MRVLQIVESFGGGVGRHVVDLVLGLHERSHEVDLIYNAARTDVGTVAGLEEMVRRGIPTHQIDMARSPSPSDFKVGREIKDLIKREGPFDVVHGQSSKGGALARMFGHHYPAVIIYTPHAISTMNPSSSGRTRMLLRLIEKSLAKRCDAIICVSPDEENHILELGIDPKKLHLVPNGLALPDSKPTRQASRKVGFVGRLEPQKDPLNLIEAFARNADKHPDWKLVIVGYGPLEEPAKQLAREHAIGDRIDWLGNQPGAAAMLDFEVFCLPSRYEAMPYVYIEALAAGLPIVSTDCGGARLAIVPDSNGLIVPVADSTELAIALDRLMSDEELRQRMSDASWQKAHEFSLDVMVDSTIKIYQEMSDEKRVGAR